MIKLNKRIINYLSVLIMTAASMQAFAQSGDCATDYTLNFADVGNEWQTDALSGSYTVGEQAFDIEIDDADHILESTNESNEGLEIRIDPHNRHDIVAITYSLSATANSVSFPIIDLDKKSGGSHQQEQVCVYGYLGNNPIAIMPIITSLDGAVNINGNCATATMDSAISGKDESILVEFSECIDRVVIEYGSGPMAPYNPSSSKIYIGKGSGFTANACGDCNENCTSENVLDFTDAGIDWTDEAMTGTYNVGTQTYTINLLDDSGILETNASSGPFSTESEEGIKIGINPNSPDDKVTACYALSEVSNKVFFKIRDLDKKTGASNQQEQVCIYGTLGSDPNIISPIVTSLNGSVMISQASNGSVCATGTTNSAISGQEESVFVEFDECIDKIFIVYGSGPMAPSDPTYSKIYIGDEFGFYTGVCGDGCTTEPTCEAEAGTLTLDGDEFVCITDNSEVSAFPNGDANIPSGYDVLFVLTKGNDLVIVDADFEPLFAIQESAEYTIHTLIYDPNTLDISTIVLDTTTGFEVNSLLIQGGGNICASLDVAGVSFTAEVLDTGVLTSQNPNNCVVNTVSVTLSATTDGNAIVPDGYELIYVLTSGDDLVIEAVDTIPNFMVSSAGIYTIHTLIYDPNTLDLSIVQFGVTTGGDVNALLVQGGGEVCGALDVGGARFLIENPNAGQITPDVTGDICSNTTNPFITIPLLGNPDSTAVVPLGYQLIYILTSSDSLLIEDINTTLPQFDVIVDNMGNGNGIYTIHTLVYNSATLDLSIVQFGVTTGFDVNALLVQGGGDICGALDVGGARFVIVNCLLAIDNDLDNDGISNIQEGNGIDPSMDMDDDGLANYEDPDFPGFVDINDDGINDKFDKDLDGIADIFDLDSDNDGIADLVEAGGTDTDGDGMVDVFVDADEDGWADAYDNDDDTTPELNDGTGIPLPNNDDDKDGLPNAIDLDSDSDGVADIVEAGGTDTNGDGYIDDITDIDGDGYADLVDTDNNTIEGPNDGGTALPRPDSDGDGRVDALDLDSDNDGISDLFEAGGKDSDNNGQLDVILDADGDGLANLVDTDNNNIEGVNDGGIALLSPDLDGDGIRNALDLDSDNDGLSDLSESISDPTIIASIDPDGNGTVSGMDMDKDGIVDGLFDSDMEFFGGTLTSPTNSDDDPIPNHLDIDADNDGIIDMVEGQLTLGYLIPLSGADVDMDGDGINDAFDKNIGDRGGFFISPVDTDSDGIPDYLDLNSDNDEEPDSIEGFDNNGDGTPELPLNGQPGDPDNDGLDGIYDEQENVYDPTNNGTYADQLANSDDNSPELDFRSAFSVNIIVNLSGAMIDVLDSGNLDDMRYDLKTRGLLPGQQLVGLGTPTPAGQPYSRAPWNYTGTEGANWTDLEYNQIAQIYEREVVDWVLVSFRRTIFSNDLIVRHAGLVLEDGRVVFPEVIDLSNEQEIYIVVEHRSHMAAMTPAPIIISDNGRVFYDFTLADSYVGPDPLNPLGAGQLEVNPGVFALYNSDGEQILDAGQAANPSYNITGADKTIWQGQNGVFNVYQASDYNMNGDTNGGDLIPFEIYNGTFSVVPR